MDHKVSKDMISSGMIPSGEKTQADLGRIQYGSAPSPSSLMDAYKSIYEHHQKDKDGNTIPHQEDLNEGKMPAGLQAYLDKKKGKKEDKKEVKEEQVDESLAGLAARGLMAGARGARVAGKLAAQGAVRARQMQASGGFRKAAGAAAQKVGQAAKGALNKPGVKAGLVSGGLAGAATGAMVAGAMGGGKKKETNNRGLIPVKGYSSYDMKFDYTPEGDLISEDLFDALKTSLIEDGCDEKNVMKIMTSITPEFINDTIQEENLDEFAFTTAAILAGKLAAKALAKKAVIGATKFAMKKGTTAAATKLVGKVGAKKAAAKYIPMAAKKAPGALAKSAVKNPINTAVAGSMVMPQGGGAPKPEAAQRGVTSGKRTAGMQRMDLDLFDVVKGQLLDEGLTEEECGDVMLTLTPEEIMNEMAVNPKIAAMDAKNKANMIAKAKAQRVPENIKAASKRQMKAGTSREDPNNPYTTQDKKDIINYNKNK